MNRMQLSKPGKLTQKSGQVGQVGQVHLARLPFSGHSDVDLRFD